MTRLVGFVLFAGMGFCLGREALLARRLSAELAAQVLRDADTREQHALQDDALDGALRALFSGRAAYAQGVARAWNQRGAPTSASARTVAYAAGCVLGESPDPKQSIDLAVELRSFCDLQRTLAAR
jgi:hypothetical protein